MNILSKSNIFYRINLEGKRKENSFNIGYKKINIYETIKDDDA